MGVLDNSEDSTVLETFSGDFLKYIYVVCKQTFGYTNIFLDHATFEIV